MRKRYAVCVGINDYPGAPLNGARPDAEDWTEEALRRGYVTTTILDRDAIRPVILEELARLVAATGYGDAALFQFSGHGTDLSGPGGDEPTDQAIVAADMRPIVDDDMAVILADRRRGAHLTLVIDACYSGSMQRFVGGPVGDGPATPRFLHPSMLDYRPPPPALPRRIERHQCVLLAACADTEVAWDAWIDGRARGAYTAAALHALEANPATYAGWHARIRGSLPNQLYPQTPQLRGGWRRYARPLP